MSDAESIAHRWELIRDALNEHQRRLWLGAEAHAMGNGGASVVARAASVSRTTVRRGLGLIEALAKGDATPDEFTPAVRVREKGGGRKTLTERQPKLLPALWDLVEPEPVSGRPSPLLWTTKSRDKLAESLNQAGHRAGGPAVLELLKAQGFRVRAVAKVSSQLPRPAPRDQFLLVSETVALAQSRGQPVLGLEWFRVTRQALASDDDPGFNAGLRRRVDDRFSDEPQVRTELSRCEVCGASKFDPGRRGEPAIETLNLIEQALRMWCTSMGPTWPKKHTRLTLVVGGLGGDESLMRHLARVLEGVARSLDLALEVLHLPAGLSRWRSVERRFSLATNMYAIGRHLDRHEVTLEAPAAVVRSIGVSRSTQSDCLIANLPRAPEAQSVRRVEFEPIGKFPNWHYRINVDRD